LPRVGDTSIAQPTSPPDASIRLTLPDAPPAPNVVDARVAKPEANPDIPPLNLTTPDARPATDVAFAPSQSDGAPVTIQDIMDSCNIPEQQQVLVLGCLARLSASWTTGMAEVLAGINCNYVAGELGCFVGSANCMAMGPQDFDPGAICMPIPVYVGVRFV
jgi:hypothetical protein